MGKPTGTYTLLITPNLPFPPVKKTTITVENGFTTNVGTIVFFEKLSNHYYKTPLFIIKGGFFMTKNKTTNT